MKAFKIGDTVTWRSQAAGYETQKVGQVAQVVPAGERPDRERFERLYTGAGAGFARDHESYVVMVVPGKTSKAAPRPYWPRVSALQMAPRPSGDSIADDGNEADRAEVPVSRPR